MSKNETVDCVMEIYEMAQEVEVEDLEEVFSDSSKVIEGIVSKKGMDFFKKVELFIINQRMEEIKFIN